MKITLDIPEVFIAHWEMDRFKDSLRRMKADADSCEMWSGNYEAELCEMLITAFEEAKEVPPHGRLVDESWLKKAMITTLEALKKNPKMDGQEMHLIAAFATLGEMVDDAPTIIEAEEET